MPRERELRRLKRKVYVDSHGQSEIGFAITRLLDFDLLARIKQINKIKLYQPDRGDPDAYPGLKPAMTRPKSSTRTASSPDM